MNYIKDSVKISNIKNTVLVSNIHGNPLSLTSIKNAIDCPKLRQEFINLGIKDAINFLQNSV